MGLTRISAQQISNIDYKQAVRVVTVSNITLSGGAPALVDGVTLSANDRILVTAQSTGSQNGLYYVQTVGSGSNGTWARTTDGNETGEIDAGMIVMVTEGVTYADTQWKLITDDPITIGSTALTFTQNYSANSISSGTSNVVVVSNGNVTISSAGTPNVFTVTATGANIAGTLNATGNATVGNLGATNIVGTLTTAAQPNITGVGTLLGLGVSGNAGFGNISGTGSSSFSGNIVGGNIVTSGQLSAIGNVSGGNIVTNGLINAGGNVTGGNIVTTGSTIATGNISGNYVLGNGAFLSGVITSVANINNGTSNVEIASANANVTVSVAGTSNVAVFSPGSLIVAGAITGVIGFPKTITSNVQVALDSTAVVISPLTVANNVSITVPDSSTLYVWTPT